MSTQHRSLTRLLAAVLAGGLLAGCDTAPAGPDGPGEPASGKKPVPPGFVLITLDPAPGQIGAYAAAVNDAHEVVGGVQYADWHGAAFYWTAASGGTPQILPGLAASPDGVAGDVNASGAIAGTVGSSVNGAFVADPVPVVWEPAGGGWTVRSLGGPGRAKGLNDLGEVVGLTYVGTNPATWLETPTYWDGSGGSVPLPIPVGYLEAHANGINRDGDISGSVSAPLPQGGTGHWAALWVRRGSADWEPVVLLDGGEAFEITDRSGDGTLMVVGHAASDPRGGCCLPVRWDVDIGAPASVATVRTTLGADYSSYGEGHGINAAGDVVGFGRKGSAWSSPQPLLFPLTGSTVVLPVPGRGSQGTAEGISSDRWVVGTVDGRAVVWHP